MEDNRTTYESYDSYDVCRPEEDCIVLKQETMPYSVFNELRISEQLVDVSLEVGKKQISAHKVVLAATIPYFRTMFTKKMLEHIDHAITIEGNIDESSFEAIINYAYGAQICITSINAQSLLVAASFFQLDRVSKECCEFLQRKLNINNVLEMHTLGNTLGYLSLAKTSRTFIRKHFEDFAKSASFLSMNSDEIIEIISKNELNVPNEEKVFEAVIAWVKHDENRRKNHLPNLLTHVRLPLLTPEYLTDFVATEELVRNSPTCRDLLEEAKNYHLMPKRRGLLQNLISAPRCSARSRLIYVVGGENNSGSLNTVEVFNCELNKWTMEEAMTSSRSGLRVAVLDHQLYAIGGFDSTSSQCLSTVEAFDVNAKRWTNVTPMNCKRCYFGVAALNDKLYACGGYNETKYLKTVECYDHEKDEWQMMPCMLKQRRGPGAVAIQGSIVVLGGYSNGATNSVERFDPQSSSWTLLPSMKTKRYGLGAAVLGNKIYVCGGYDGSYLQTAEVFDPQTNQWSFIASMNTKRCGVSLVANSGRLYALGGHDGNSYVSSVEVYNPEKNEWSFVAPMSEAKNFFGSFVLWLLKHIVFRIKKNTEIMMHYFFENETFLGFTYKSLSISRLKDSKAVIFHKN